VKRPSREERRARAKREIARKTHENCPIQLAIDARRPPETQLSPFPQDDLVETPAPRPSLAPFGTLSGEEQTRRGSATSPIRRAGCADAEYVELHARSAFSFLVSPARRSPASASRLT